MDEVKRNKFGQRIADVPCERCGQIREVLLMGGKPRSKLCRRCNVIVNRPHWKGGDATLHGYVLVYKPDHPKAYKTGYIKRARIVLEEKLGRYLFPHHLNGIKSDDRPENLVEMLDKDHKIFHWQEGWGAIAKLNGAVLSVPAPAPCKGGNIETMLSEMPEECVGEGSPHLLECGYEIWLLHRLRGAVV